MTEQIKKVLEKIKELTQREFYGKMEITFRKGRITFLRYEETEKVD